MGGIRFYLPLPGKSVQTYGRAYGGVITKFSRMDSLPNFITHGAPLRSLRARRLPYYTCTTYQSLFKVVVTMYFSFRWKSLKVEYFFKSRFKISKRKL